MNKIEYILLSIPIVLSIIVMAIANFIMGERGGILINNFEMLSGNYISFASILIGFLTTTIGIVIGFIDKKIIKIIVKKRQDKILYINWVLTIVTGILSIVILFYIMVVFNVENKIIDRISMSIFVFFMIMFVGYLIFSLIYFLGIAKSVMRESLQEDNVTRIDKAKVRDLKDI